MKKRYLLSLFTIMLITLSIVGTEAKTITTGRIGAIGNLNIRSGPGTNYGVIASADYNSRVTILENSSPGDGCENNWVEIISANRIRGYVCSTYIFDIETTEVVEQPISEEGQNMANMTDEEFDQYLTSQHFPDDYKVKLKALHKKHPTWIFKGVVSKYNWNSALNTQDQSGTSLVHVNPTDAQNGYEGYLSTAPADYNHNTDTFIKHDGTYWFQANRATIAYFLDPRNFLDENQIFMFEELFYHPTYQTIDLVNNALSSDFLRQFAQYFMEGGEAAQVSPIFLASLSKQEVGTSSNNECTNGHAGSYEGVNYDGYYNFFNIGASSSDNPKLASLRYAKAVGWNTQQKAIVEGSKSISNNYVNCGQYTSYFQKFNLAPTATKPLWHQYTTNIGALISPAYSTANAYRAYNLIEKDFVFAIPIYNQMPESTPLPRLGNPNNWLKSIKVNGATVTNFNSDNLNYTVTVPYAETVQVEAERVTTKSTVTGAGTITLADTNTTVPIKVTAQNGDVRNYSVTIVREAKPEDPPTPPDDGGNGGENGGDNGNTGTEDPPTPTITITDVLNSSGYNYTEKYISKITIGTSIDSFINKLMTTYKTISVNIKDKNGNAKTSGQLVTGDKVIIVVGETTTTLEVVIYGDVDGNGVINVGDLLHIQKHILSLQKMTGPFEKSADINRDSKITVIDILSVQKQVLGIMNISQG